MCIDPIRDITAAEVELPCQDLGATLTWFTERLGFLVESIQPADDPEVAVIAAHGLRLQLRRSAMAPPPLTVRLRLRDPDAFAGGAGTVIAPGGTRIELVAAEPPLELPPLRPEFVVAHLRDAVWKTGRAGMRYRDLIPGRQGGRFIASHIQIAAGGPVPDYVHFHRVAVQLLYCWHGSVRLVYEDQGPPFTMLAGDCVLQPPTIRHRVLECSPGFEVIEVASPAAHATVADRKLALPTAALRPGRSFGGQRFVHHRASAGQWQPLGNGLLARSCGLADATAGAVEARVLQAGSDAIAAAPRPSAGELQFLFVLAGTATLRADGHGATPLQTGDAATVPAGCGHVLADASPDLQLLEVTAPATAAYLA